MTAPISANPEIEAQLFDKIPLGRAGEPDDIAGVVAFLCSNDARSVTGQWIAVDGGLTSVNYRPKTCRGDRREAAFTSATPAHGATVQRANRLVILLSARTNYGMARRDRRSGSEMSRGPER